MNAGQVDRGVYTFHQTIVALVRRDGRDLTARQLGVLLTSYLDIEAQTVRGLARLIHEHSRDSLADVV